MSRQAPAPFALAIVVTVVLVSLSARARALPPAPRPGGAAIHGTLAVSIVGPALKHWGISAVTAAFVPDTDRSAYARRIRAASDADALCAALTGADGRDASIASAHAEGDGDLQHRSGDEMQLAFRIEVPRLEAAAHGSVYICSSPILAVVARGGYPDERFERIADQRFRWRSAPLTLHPGEAAHIAGAASIDASNW